MNTILISYDLNKTGKEYERVITYIKSLGYWAKPLQNQFLVKSDLTDAQIVDGLLANGADTDDSIFVVDVTGRSAAWSHMPQTVADWMKDNL